MIIGTAGHIDHGKTTLVRALTGVDTDRLKEEKARGISIELGYAYVPVEGGSSLGFIDVPGHEKFVATMLAGATGIDFGLVVVAADDGPMPQTREHVQILDLLGVRDGAVALTKIDRADPARRAAVAAEMHALLATTTLADVPVFEVDALHGEGVEALRAHLLESARGHRGRGDGGHFRLAVDRSFSIAGAGTVVTGTVFSGRVAVGDEVRIAPSGLTARVRSLHAQNRPAETGRAGERCALNLAGVARDQVVRGDWIAAPDFGAVTDRIDVELSVAEGESRAIGAWMPVHAHLGAAHLTARVVPLGEDAIAPGATGLAQLVLSSPTLVVQGDLLVLRDTSATRTLGRARVLDLAPPARRRRAPQRLALLEALRARDAGERLQRLVAITPTGVDLDVFARHANLLPGDMPADGGDWKVVRDGAARRAFAPAHWQALRDTVVASLTAFHAREPDRPGPDLAALRRLALPAASVETAAAVMRALVGEGVLAQSGPFLHLPGRSVAISEAERRILRVLVSLIAKGGFDPPAVRDLAGEIRLEDDFVRRLLAKAARLGELHPVVKDHFFTPEQIARLADLVRDIVARDGAARAASYRDATGVGRKKAIWILEYFDRIGFTRRIGDDHLLRDATMFASASRPEAGAA